MPNATSYNRLLTITQPCGRSARGSPDQVEAVAAGLDLRDLCRTLSGSYRIGPDSASHAFPAMRSRAARWTEPASGSRCPALHRPLRLDAAWDRRPQAGG